MGKWFLIVLIVASLALALSALLTHNGEATFAWVCCAVWQFIAFME